MNSGREGLFFKRGGMKDMFIATLTLQAAEKSRVRFQLFQERNRTL